MHVRLYRQLRLTAEERARLAVHWKSWRQLNTALDASFHDSLQLLQCGAQAADVPAAFTEFVGAVAAGKCATPRPPIEDLDDDDSFCETCARLKPEHAQNRTDRDAGGREFAADYSGRRSGTSPVWEGMLSVLGCSAQASATAVKGFQALVHVHEAHGRVVADMKMFQLLPGVLLQPLQFACVYSAHVLSGTAPADVLHLCQLADAQDRWRRGWEPLKPSRSALAQQM